MEAKCNVKEENLWSLICKQYLKEQRAESKEQRVKWQESEGIHPVALNKLQLSTPRIEVRRIILTKFKVGYDQWEEEASARRELF